MKFIQKNKAIVIILVVGFMIRIVALGYNPPSLNWDEVSHGYNAYSVLKTGKDEWGRTLPLIFRAYGDYKLPVYIYLTIPFVAVFGLNAWAVRLPSALSGLGSIIFTYLLVKKLTKNKNLSILSAAFVAFEPWTFFVSRAALEANLALFLITAATYFFINSLKKGRSLVISVIFFGLSVWTYNTARIFVPLFLLFLVLIYKKQLFNQYKIKKLFFPGVILSIFMVPMFYQLLMPQGQARYNLVSILNPSAIGQIEKMRLESGHTSLATRLLYNRVTYFVPRFAENYASHFSPNFLFFGGASHYQFSVPRFGLLTLANILGFYLGAIYLVKERRQWQVLILGWILLGPIASSVTKEAPHALRSLIMVPAIFIITAYGIYKIYNLVNKTGYKYILVIFYILFLLYGYEKYYLYYFQDYRRNYSWAWQDGNKQLVQLIKEKYDDYDAFIFTKKYGEPHAFILFYWPRDPSAYHSDPNLNRFYQSNWYWVDRFDKFYFVNDWEIAEGPQYQFNLESGEAINCGDKACLLITSPDNAPSDWNKIDEIRFLNGEIAYEIYQE